MKTCAGCGHSGGLTDFARWDALCHACRERRGPRRSQKMTAAERHEDWLAWAGLRLEATDSEIAAMWGTTISSLRNRFYVLRGKGYELPPAQRPRPYRVVRDRGRGLGARVLG